MDPRLAASDVRILGRGSDHVVALWRQVYIVDFHDTPSKEALDAAVLGKGEAHAANPGGVVVLNLLPGDRPLPSAEVRDYAERKQSEDLAGVLAHATVVTGEGFRAGALRSMLAGLYLVSRSPFPRKVFSDVGEAAAWQATIVSAGRDWAPGLVAAVAAVRAPRAT